MHFQQKEDLIFRQAIQENTLRYTELFSQAADTIMPQRSISNPNTQDFQYEQQNQLPSQLTRKFQTFITTNPSEKNQFQTKIRNLNSNRIGKLSVVVGIVTKITDVKPCMRVVCYICEICGHEVFQSVSGKEYLPLNECPSQFCIEGRTKGKLFTSTRGCKFVNFQEISLQESPEQVPMGSIPRLQKVYAFGCNTRVCHPGDQVEICGVLVSQQFTGPTKIKQNLIHDTYFEAYRITNLKKSFKITSIPKEIILHEIQNSGIDMYTKLALSIAPEIHGLEDIKKSLLLQLVGGVDIQRQDGMRIRGHVNVLLMGDPGLAKSQLLKFISNIAPRSVYTTGKGSSGVGLTAAVMRDQYSKELILEAGALVLADQGICCIDEFDKMDENDRTSIHEVMEQQSVSIAKGGIQTSLNARTSILAAANPVYGRYNKKISPEQNINLPAALLSRFDLIILMLDTPDKEQDKKLADHITYVHKHKQNPQSNLNFQLYNQEFLLGFISEAKKYEAVIPKSLHYDIAQKYSSRRQQKKYGYTTPRTLLAVIRISQALARVRFSNEVSKEDVLEAIRLVESSYESVQGEQDKRKDKVDITTQIWNLISNTIEDNGNVDYLKNIVINRGFNEEQFHSTVKMYIESNLVMFVDNNARLIKV